MSVTCASAAAFDGLHYIPAILVSNYAGIIYISGCIFSKVSGSHIHFDSITGQETCLTSIIHHCQHRVCINICQCYVIVV